MNRPYRPSPRRAGHVIVPIIILLAAIVMAIGICFSMSTQETVSFTVRDKERVCSVGTDDRTACRYLVYTDNGTYSNTDNLLFGKTNSADIQGCLTVGKTYSGVVVNGLRNSLFSMFQNILKVPGC